MTGRADQAESLFASAQTDDFTLTVPAGYAIGTIYVLNKTANAITGGLKVGTTAGGTEVVTALTVGASAFTSVAPTINIFSATSTQTLFIRDVTAWNSASIDMVIPILRAIP